MDPAESRYAMGPCLIGRGNVNPLAKYQALRTEVTSDLEETLLKPRSGVNGSQIKGELHGDYIMLPSKNDETETMKSDIAEESSASAERDSETYLAFNSLQFDNASRKSESPQRQKRILQTIKRKGIKRLRQLMSK